MHRKKIVTVPADQRFGVNEFDDGIWPLSLMPYDLGYFDLKQRTLPIPHSWRSLDARTYGV